MRLLAQTLVLLLVAGAEMLVDPSAEEPKPAGPITRGQMEDWIFKGFEKSAEIKTVVQCAGSSGVSSDIPDYPQLKSSKITCFDHDFSDGSTESSSGSDDGKDPPPPTPPKDLPPAVPAPPPPPPQPEGPPRINRGEPWGPFQLAKVKRHGIHIGWGATCSRHTNAADINRLDCKKQTTFGKDLSSDEVLRNLKRWLIRGYDIPVDGEFSRKSHIAIGVRDIQPVVHADEDLWQSLLLRAGPGPWE
jgi:type IV secretory pathway VirB10-like protein